MKGLAAKWQRERGNSTAEMGAAGSAGGVGVRR